MYIYIYLAIMYYLEIMSYSRDDVLFGDKLQRLWHLSGDRFFGIGGTQDRRGSNTSLATWSPELVELRT